MDNAWEYHTAVSLHINMMDAYQDSPLWKSYDDSNIILKDKSGTPIMGEIQSGTQSYQISYTQEWKLGLAQKRIDALLKMLPELQRAGTVHIDAFHSISPMRLDEVAPPICPDFHSLDCTEGPSSCHRGPLLRGHGG